MSTLSKWALGALAFLGLSIGLATQAQAYGGHYGHYGHRGGLTVSFGGPYSGASLYVPVGHHRYHHRRAHPYYYSGYGYHPYAYYYPPRYRYRHAYRHRPHYWGHHPRWRDHDWRHHRKHWRRHHRWH